MTQKPISLGDAAKRDVRTQFAALPFRIVQDKVQVLLITSRGTKRWILPKGWPMDGMTPAQSAAEEAFEEAGVKGKAFDICLGVYSYNKVMAGTPDLPCLAMVFPLKVKRVLSEYPEKSERRRKWLPLKQAADKISEPELRAILKGFDPRLLKL
ncbi:MAG: NUDIX hydrolase [Pseudomonadota bacterium]